ncbi:MAG: malonyl-CoA decarboxylase [Rhodobacteraceae bacterium]|nr:malonyl-CoA decarboxylase [Paracoccaceae bacterium]
MSTTGPLNELLTTLLERRPFQKRSDRNGAINDLCMALLEEKTEVSGLQTASAILDRYQDLEPDKLIDFFTFLNDKLDVDAEAIAKITAQYKSENSASNFKQLAHASEPRRQELFRRLNEVSGATAELVNMRADLLKLLKETPILGRTDFDLVHLLRSWFNRGFLVLRQITWDTSASILEKIIAYEAVHEIQNWDDLRRRLHPSDRRCFAFFHPAMPDDPLIFVEVALTKGVPGSIQKVLSDQRETLDASEADTAVFYSISNCQAGLAGISFGDSLIKQVVRDLSHELLGIKRFVTLSPIPGFGRWTEKHGDKNMLEDTVNLKKIAAHYLLEAKKADGKPFDPVARFHLGNGAIVHMIHSEADTSEKGMAQSGGIMVNYLYDLNKISQNVGVFGNNDTVVASSAVRSLAKQAARYIPSDST